MLQITLLVLSAGLVTDCSAQYTPTKARFPHQPLPPPYTKIRFPKVNIPPLPPRRLFDGRGSPPGSLGQAAESAFKATHSKYGLAGGQYGLGVRLANTPTFKLGVSGVTNFKGSNSVGLHAILRLGRGGRKRKG